MSDDPNEKTVFEFYDELPDFDRLFNEPEDPIDEIEKPE